MLPRFYDSIPSTATPLEAMFVIILFLGMFLLFWSFWRGLNWWADKYPAKRFAPDYKELPDGTLRVMFRPMVGPRGGVHRPLARVMTREEYDSRYGQYPPHPKPEPRWMSGF